jgi:dimethylaniline monooxygenase (N-oxide forming)
MTSMNVCVIGAGPAGLTTIKQLRDEGHNVVCFERDADIGGVWYRYVGDDSQTKVFDSLILTVSMKLMSFSDFIHQGERTFADHRGYLRYLHAYAEKFGLRQFIRFDTVVNSIKFDGEMWTVVVTTPDGEVEHEFGAVAICTGPFQTPNDKIPELAGFTGPVMHSSRYRNAEAFRGKRVLIVGLAESGADVVREISDVAAACTLAIRSHTFLLPRLFYGKYSTDMTTFRSHHHEAWVRSTNVQCPKGTFWGDWWGSRAFFLLFAGLYGLISVVCVLLARPFQQRPKVTEETLNNLGQPMLPEKLDLFCENTQAHVDAINEWNEKSHAGAGTWSMRKIFCKNVSFIPNFVNGKFHVKEGGVESSNGHVVSFTDSTAQEYDEVVLCTGFSKHLSQLLDIQIPDNNIRNLYKLAFHPDYGGRLAIIGISRPYSGGIPICAEMQARYFALMCSGKAKLPADVKERIEKEKAWLETWTSLSPRHDDAIPSQIMFLDSIASEIGCLMPVSQLIFRPRLLVKHWFFSFNQACYRLTGPHSDPVAARREILAEKIPSEDVRLIMRMTMLSFLPHFIHPKNLKIEV